MIPSVLSFVQRLVYSCSLLVVPPQCYACRRFLSQRDALCSECISLVQPIVAKELPLTTTTSMMVHALGVYQEPLRSLILAKNSPHPGGVKLLAKLMAERMQVDKIPVDVLVPVPLHWTRYAARGFNQAAVIAQELSTVMQVPVAAHVRRKRRTQLQAGLSRDERADNLKNVFSLTVDPSFFHHKHIVIVDDVLTSGATLRALGSLLLKSKPASISAFVACRPLGK